MTAASNGDTVYLAPGNWALDTGNAPATTSKTISLIGGGSGNTFDVYGHPNNGFTASAAAFYATITPAGSITRLYTTGANFSHGAGAGGYVKFNSCSNVIVSNIFFDGSQATNGGVDWGTLNFNACPGSTVNNIRAWSFKDATIESETQFFVFGSANFTAKNSVFAAPPFINGGGFYSGAEVFQDQWHDTSTITNNQFYQQTYNGFFMDNVSIIGNSFYTYTDSIGMNPIIASQSDEGCSNTGCYNGSTTGNFHYFARNNYVYASGVNFGVGGGVNDPSTNGIVNDQQWSGNWLFGSGLFLDTCSWRFNGSCPAGAVGSIGMQVQGMSFTSNSVVGTTYAVINFTGDGCPDSGGNNVGTGSPCSGSLLNSMQCVNCSAQNNYLSSPSNMYLTDANSVSPSQSNNYCTGSTFSGCNTSGFATPPTCSFAVGTMSGSTVPFTSTSFTAQFGSVQWLASTTSTAPISSDSRWISNSGNFSGTAANSYLPPVQLSGVAHGNTVYAWVMDSANHIAACGSAVIP